VVDSAACPVTAGIPKVVRASLIKERDLFARQGVAFVDDVIQFAEPNYLKKQMFEIWGPRLEITRDENDVACDQGWQALTQFDQEAQQRGRELLGQVAQRGGLAVLALCRPYHHDPGVHHGVFEQLQSLGYPVLTIRCLPRDPASLDALFGEEVADGVIDSPMDIRDVWPENYSAHSAEKVWAAKYAARHRHLAVLDLSSFKCGNDAPTYSVIDGIIKAAGIPYAMLHDIDANKSVASMKLRVRTFAYVMDCYRERMSPRATESGSAQTLIADAPAKQNESRDAQRNASAVEPRAEPQRAALRRPAWRLAEETPFTAEQRESTTILVGGLTAAHDSLVEAGWRSLGYRVQALPQADTAAFRLGKEYGSRAQCNPAYFTVGNLLKHLHHLRDEQGVPTERIIRDYVFLTAGACGPCRFGVYAAEYRKALRDAGFAGFRVLTFQQAGLWQPNEPHTAVELRPRFFLQLIRGLMCGDVLNMLGYRLRPYERTPGATDETLTRSLKICYDALLHGRSVKAALRQCRRLFREVAVDRLVSRPKVEVTGEFWALTTEGDGNYRLQRFLESEGAEVVVTPVTAWILYLIWQHRYDTLRRIDLPVSDAGRRGLRGKRPRKKLGLLALSEFAVRRWFASYCRAVGLDGYTLPDMERLAALGCQYYPAELRGGEGHLEVGRFIQAAQERRAHLVVSVKPFGCLPSSCVSDGVQALVTRRYPEMLFCPVETTGDAHVNAYSRAQMMLFRARQLAESELAAQVNAAGVDVEVVRRSLESCDDLCDSLHAAPTTVACTAANVFREVAQRIGGVVH
jgi:predicted nucleotide-binding protein (sugar kinase/HSP70/actin superfamily)